MVDHVPVRIPYTFPTSLKDDKIPVKTSQNTSVKPTLTTPRLMRRTLTVDAPPAPAGKSHKTRSGTRTPYTYFAAIPPCTQTLKRSRPVRCDTSDDYVRTCIDRSESGRTPPLNTYMHSYYVPCARQDFHGANRTRGHEEMNGRRSERHYSRRDETDGVVTGYFRRAASP